MFTKIKELIKKYFSLVDDIVVDFLTDIKSLRYQLVLAGFAFNIYLFVHGASVNVMLAAIGLLTAVYTMYFASKHHQAQMENQTKKNSVDSESGEAGDSNE